MKEVTFKTVFHPSDFSGSGEIAWLHALKISLMAQAKLSLLHVAAKGDHIDWSEFPHVRPTLKRWGIIDDEGSKSSVVDAGLNVQKVAFHDDKPAEAIASFIAKRRQDLVVLSTNQRKGLSRWLKTETSGKISRASTSMTLFVPRRVSGFVDFDDGSVRLKSVLLPVDRLSRIEIVTNNVVKLLKILQCEDVTLTFLHVGKKKHMPKFEFDDCAGWKIKRVAKAGDVVDTILDVAAEVDADLIAMDTDGRHGFLDAMFGTTTEKVIREANCPVLAVPVHK
jgi:nucleotide-binding universal stress UspA family protein